MALVGIIREERFNGLSTKWLEGLIVGEPLTSGAVYLTHCQKPASTAIVDKGGQR